MPGAQPADDLQARELRQAQIDDGYIEGVLEAGEQAFLPVGCDIDREARVREAGLEHVAQRSFILDNQHAHGMPLVTLSRSSLQITVPVRSQCRWPHRPSLSRHGRSR